MKPKSIGFFVFLIALAAFIWLRNTAWMTSSDDTLPILVALPLAIWLGMPWKLKEEKRFLAPLWVIGAAVLFLAGILTDLTILLACGWTACFYAWQKEHLEEASLKRAKALSALVIMAFPWVTLDAVPLGWYFRLSGAYVTAFVLNFFGYDVVQKGTNITVGNTEILVEAACSGLNTLQSLLIAGITLAFFTFDNCRRVFANIPNLFAAAWIANTTRIFLIVLLSVYLSPEFVLGPFHIWLGWATIVFIFIILYAFFLWQKRSGRLYPFSFFTIALLLYTGYCSRELVSAWQVCNYDQQGWAALLIWLIPIFFGGEQKNSMALSILAILFATAGFIGALNTLCYIGFACALATLSRSFSWRSICSWCWLFAAASWMPLLGWLLKAYGVDTVFWARIFISTFGTLLALL
jgi:exosortase/archaeosortase family protein